MNFGHQYISSYLSYEQNLWTQSGQLTVTCSIPGFQEAMGFLVERSFWALVMPFYTLFMVFGPKKNFKLISGRFGENPEFLDFSPFFRPQKVFLLPNFLLLTLRP